MHNFPRITVITPSFNQGKFLRDTIESVLGQGYPNLEYMVLDGGSKDESVEIIKQYEKHLTFWCSERDGGQAAAINRGFTKSTGDILAWLNSDDYLLPGALRFAAEQLNIEREEILIGNCFHFVEGGSKCDGFDVEGYHGRTDLAALDYVKQPSSFWTKKLWNKVGLLEVKWNWVFDWDWYIRAQKSGASFITTPRYLSGWRLHADSKNPIQRKGDSADKRQDEIHELYLRHADERIVRLHELCRKHHAFIRKVKRRAKQYKLTKLMKDIDILKLIFPNELKGVTSKQVDQMLDVVSF